MQVIVRTMARFINTYLPDLLTTILQPSILEFSEQMESKATGVLTLLASGVRLRSLIAPLRAAYKIFTTPPYTAETNNAVSLCKLFRLAGLAAANMQRDDVQSQSQPFFAFFLAAFEFRTSPRSTKSVLAVEEAAIDAFGKLVLKLNEALFRPMFLTIADWAQVNGVAVLQGSVGYNPTRCQVFYRLVNHLGELLKVRVAGLAQRGTEGLVSN